MNPESQVYSALVHLSRRKKAAAQHAAEGGTMAAEASGVFFEVNVKKTVKTERLINLLSECLCASFLSTGSSNSDQGWL